MTTSQYFYKIKTFLAVGNKYAHTVPSCAAPATKLTPWLMEPGGSMPHSQGLFDNTYTKPNQPNSPRNDTYLFKVHSNIVLLSTHRPP